jgi:putative FmdB family regulatory protein
MPIYTYRCENCGVQFDQTQKFSDPLLTKCPECGKKTLQKVYQPVGIVFKGSGFYATDHRSPSGTARAASDKKQESDSRAGEKPESKPGTKTDSKNETAPKKETTPAAVSSPKE